MPGFCRALWGPGGYFHIWRSEGLGPKICLWNSCWSPKFCLQKYKLQIPHILPSEFQIWLQNWDFFPTFASCGDSWTSQNFPLIWWTWPDLAPNFAFKLDVRSKPPPPSFFQEVPLPGYGGLSSFHIKFWHWTLFVPNSLISGSLFYLLINVWVQFSSLNNFLFRFPYYTYADKCLIDLTISNLFRMNIKVVRNKMENFLLPNMMELFETNPVSHFPSLYDDFSYRNLPLKIEYFILQ